MSDTLYSRICALGERDVSRFHMPGHKGKLDLFGGKPFARYDLTEIPGADSLYDAEDVIAACERGYATLYGAARTALSAGGATLPIQADGSPLWDRQAPGCWWREAATDRRSAR